MQASKATKYPSRHQEQRLKCRKLPRIGVHKSIIKVHLSKYGAVDSRNHIALVPIHTARFSWKFVQASVHLIIITSAEHSLNKPYMVLGLNNFKNYAKRRM